MVIHHLAISRGISYLYSKAICLTYLAHFVAQHFCDYVVEVCCMIFIVAASSRCYGLKIAGNI